MTTTRPTTLAGAAEAVGDLLTRSARLGRDLLSGVVLPDPGALLARAAGGCGCEIPDPCWYPRRLGPVRSHVCPGGTAVLRITVTNCGPASQAVGVDVKGSGVTVDPAKATIDPYEDATFVVSAAVPTDAASGDRTHTVWVRGCRVHVLRWTVSTIRRGGDSCHEVSVDDCADQVHHWYDHFYCQRPCGSGPRQG
ncbi:MAG TPA: hypothetical protein VM324_00830 [Egibacteraceae bacterium]|jgi:hypothetical protein|nr:hypothetical protein [Egibacteraceae bacterium]